MNNILLLSVALLALSYFLTCIIRKYSNKSKLLDIPNERSSHSVPVPRGGGIGIVVPWYIGISALYFLEQIPTNLYLALLCGVMIAVVSFVDDLVTVRPSVRLLVQGICVVSALLILGFDTPLEFNFFKISNNGVLFLLAVFGMLWFINLFNFLDGIDGYASLEAIAVSLAIIIITGDYISLVLIACVIGFLIWNWPKAKIFMGDIGSTQLGFILSVLAIYYHGIGDLHIFQWIILTSLFWFDATVTLLRRFRNGEKLSVAHRKHAYQRIVISGFSHQKTILYSLLVNGVVFFIAFLTSLHIELLIPLLIVDIIFLYILIKLIDRKIPFA